MSVPSKGEVLQQSESAIKQYNKIWIANASHNRKHNRRSQMEIANIGKGKTVECFAYGPSLKENIKRFKQLPEDQKGDVCCCDKAFQVLINEGIKPKLVLAADAQISGEKYVVPYKEYTKDVILAACVTLNPEWTDNWEGPIYFYANRDNLNSHEYYGTACGCTELILAGSNVSNSLVVFVWQVMGYSQINLWGYDFSWKDQYYGEKKDLHGSGNFDKKLKMGQFRKLSSDGKLELLHTSANLLFSCRWLEGFIQGFNVNAKNMSDSGILSLN